MSDGTLRISTSSTGSRKSSPSNALRTSDLSSSVTSTTHLLVLEYPVHPFGSPAPLLFSKLPQLHQCPLFF
uniref:Uncharacterized protein n=1 Tax=Cucumis sativus TaxID=3659 RepID=A0A0A0KHY6_CUCSA